MKGKRVVPKIVISLCLVLIPNFSGGEDTQKHSNTITVLRELYKGEVTACKVYLAFAQKASKEKYNSVERLFNALRKSESIHARNFKKLLTSLGTTIGEIPEPEYKIASTKNNLKYALNAELSEIDMKYPEYIERIKKEGVEEAIEDITYAWKAEKQHRELIKKMQSAIGFFFGKIVKKLKEADRYFVCHRCGSTVFELPKDVCIICGSPVIMYEEVK